MNSSLSPTAEDAGIEREAARRRTFAIISHPDAGKTTLTEKLLLYAGAIEQAGSVRHKAQQRHARSDWLEMEQARGISVTSTVLQFERDGLCFNLLDTPGHQDFSEDTYRVLTAVDGAVMVIDAAKGVEPQTRKLFAVCRQRRIPVLTFVNKLDLPGRDPLDLLDEIEAVLGMAAIPFDCPLGTGSDFRGVFDLRRSQVLRFERVAGGQRPAPMTVGGLDDPELIELLGTRAHARFREEVELLGALGTFEREAFRAGRQTPVFFGSALNNFGVETFLHAIGELAPPPGPRQSDAGLVVPGRPELSGFVFKIQANMDRQHRDSMAFVRIVSGRFRKGMSVHHGRLGRRVRLPRAHRVFAQERETTEEAFPGDVVGLVNPGLFAIGDTISESTPLRFEPMPHFPTEHFARLWPVTVDKHKAFAKGLRQLEEEGAIQVLYAHAAVRRDPILAAVGELQFDLVRARLSAEYGVETRLERLPHKLAMTVDADAEETLGSLRVNGTRGETVLLFESDWAVRHFRERQAEALQAARGPGLEAVGSAQ